MEKTTEKEKKRGGIRQTVLQIRTSLESTLKEIQRDGRSLIGDLLIFTVGFLLSRCQILLGARPLGIAYVSLLSSGVWPALLGTVIGSITLGFDGIIFAVATVIVALLRVAVSISDRQEDGGVALFCESLLLRISVSVLSGFVVAVYEVLMLGLNEATLLFDLAMIILTPIITFLLSGICTTGIDLWELIDGKEDMLRLSDLEGRERYDRIFFQISSLGLIAFISLSFKDVSLLGISFSYLFSVIITLLVARRFGAIRALATGFISTLVISGEQAVSFALAGLCSGIMMSFGTGYAIVAGGVALCVWAAYSSGLNGLLSTLPEYMIGAAISLPLLKKVGDGARDEPRIEGEECAEDMVGTMALAYQKDFSGSVDRLDTALSSLAEVVGKYNSSSVRLSEEEYREILTEASKKACVSCNAATECTKAGIRPIIKNTDAVVRLLCEGIKIDPAILCIDGERCAMADELAVEINREVGHREQERYLKSGIGGVADEYSLMSGLIASARAEDDAERRVDSTMTEPLTEAIEKCGFNNGIIRAFGTRRRHFILAGEDGDGNKITSFELRRSIEEAAGVKLGAPEFYRRGKMALMECDVRPSYKVSYATATESGSSGEVSGDTAICFESGGDRFYSLISDGMGSGETARETSAFVGEFIRKAMDIGAAKESLLHLLNHSIRQKGEECSATVDLMELDLLGGGALFIKSGAPPSYVKRDSSIFRIRSQTAPIGLMRSIDSEKISVQIKGGDYIFMLSDGIAEICEDAPWLLLLLGEEPPRDLKEYASQILREAKKNSPSGDDMTVTVIKVECV